SYCFQVFETERFPTFNKANNFAHLENVPFYFTQNFQMDDGPFRKNLEQATVFNSAKDEEQQSQLFYHIYIVLKPNEEHVNEATRYLLQRIEELVPDKTESNLHGEHLSE